MRILVIQFAPATRNRRVPRFEPGLAVLLAVLRERGHSLGLVGLAGHQPEAIKKALAQSLPQLIYADISAVSQHVARRSLQFVQEHEFLPVVVGGEYPTIDPSGSLSLPGVIAAAVGEAEASLVAYLQRQQDPAFRQVVQGIWLRDETGLERPSMPALIEDLDSLPFAERELFNDFAAVASNGEIEMAVGRGCPQRCAYCLNPALATVHEKGGAWVRRRSAGNVLEEIAQLRQRYKGVAGVRFLDHAFGLDRDWLAGFLPRYASECGLPFRCHLRANAVDAQLVRALQSAGCRHVQIELISASDFLRNEIFQMDLSGAQIRSTFELLAQAGIDSTAIVYLGAPYESEASLADTAALLRALRPGGVDVRAYFPWPGTPAGELSRANGWVHPRADEQLLSDAPGLLMPACRPEIIVRWMKQIRSEMRVSLGEPWWRRWSTHTRAALRRITQRSS